MYILTWVDPDSNGISESGSYRYFAGYEERKRKEEREKEGEKDQKERYIYKKERKERDIGGLRAQLKSN